MIGSLGALAAERNAVGLPPRVRDLPSHGLVLDLQVNRCDRFPTTESLAPIAAWPSFHGWSSIMATRFVPCVRFVRGL